MGSKEKRIRLIMNSITKKPLTFSQVILIKSLYESGNHWVSKSELAYRMQESSESRVDKILGGLGKRINETEGVVPPFDGIGLMMGLDMYHGELHYRILPELIIVVKNFSLLQKAMKMSVDEIRSKYNDGLVV